MTKEIIARFFKKQCTAAEAREVVKYFNKNPELVDEYLDETEWNATDPDIPVPDQYRDEIWSGITKKKREGLIIFWIKRTAIAASVLGVFGLGYYRFTRSPNVKNYISNVAAANKNTPPAPEHKYVTNQLKKTAHVILSDGSGIGLYPGSAIQYTIPFQNNKREIYLEGEAYFTVAKDKTKPFTVFAGVLATTALGTEFRITAKKNAPGNITVKLFTGKVAIRSTRAGLKGWSKDVYLLPGQQMKYNADKMFVSIEKINSHKFSGNVFSKPVADAGKELNFNGASLPYVIDQLSKYFSTGIAYNKAQLKAMNFTGTITKIDSLPNVLKAIGQMNDLEIVQKNNGFVIQKPPK